MVDTLVIYVIYWNSGWDSIGNVQFPTTTIANSSPGSLPCSRKTISITGKYTSVKIEGHS